MIQALSPIGGQPSLSEIAYQQIRSAIVSGQLQSGQRLVYRSVAEELGISPTPVRDAIQRLVSDGALQSDERGVAYVPIVTPADYIEIINLRLNLEGLAADAAAARVDGRDHTAEALAQTHERLAQCKSEGRIDEALFENERFHSLFVKAAGMPVLEELIRSLWLRSGPTVRLLYSGNSNGHNGHPHEQLIQAIQNGDRLKARAAVEEDLKTAARHILLQLDPEAQIPGNWV